MSAPLDAATVAARSGAVPEWSVRDDSTRIERDYKFKDFAGAFAFVSRVAAIAEAADHHPDISFGWGYARLSLQTHSIGGLAETDFTVAVQCDQALPEQVP